MPASFFSHLECSVPCGAGPYDARHLHQVCTCGAPLLARYDLTAAKKWPRTSLAGRESSMWRYREILPLLESEKGLDAPVTLGEGWTPLVRARRLGKSLGLDRVYVKNEAGNPTGSAKARGVSAAVTRALHGGARVLSVGAAGHAGTALGAYAAHANLEARVFFTQDTPRAFVDECGLYGARVEIVQGTTSEATDAAGKAAAAQSWFDVTSLREPYRLEGAKTVGLELAEQLGWQVPDWILCPVGTGLGLAAIWKAFSEMASLGWIDPVRRPHLVCVQAAGCAPLVRAFGSGAEKAAPWESVRTVADGLRAPQSIGDFLALRAIKESNGLAVTAGDAEAVAGMRDFGALEGIAAGPEGGAALYALRVLAGEGRIKAHDTVVIVNTGAAAPSLDLLQPKP